MSVESKSATEQKLRLKDGRTLCFAEYGDPGGKPVLEFHGWPGSRLEAWSYDEAGKKAGARIIGVDRPGFGESTYVKGYRIVDWPRDLVEFANALGFEKFAVAGISSGSPYSLVCARFIAERLTACAVVAGVPPLKVEGEKIKPGEMIEPRQVQIARLANIFPFAARLGFGYILRQFKKGPDKAMQSLAKVMPESELQLLNDPEAKKHFHQETFAECARNGTKGPIASVGLEVKPWGFQLQDIDMHVDIWHGDADNLVMPRSAAYMASKLLNHTLHTVPGAGHLSLIGNHADEVVRGLVSAT